MERAVRVGRPSLGIITCIPGAGRCPMCAHDSRKVENSRVVRALCRTLLFPRDEGCAELTLALVGEVKREM